MAISRSIVGAIRSLDPPGRFLDKDPVTGLWFDIGHKKAIEKTSQALRDGAAVLRRQLSADLGDPGFLNNVFAEEEEQDDDDDKITKDNEKASEGCETSIEKPVQPDQALSSKKPIEKLKPVKKVRLKCKIDILTFEIRTHSSSLCRVVRRSPPLQKRVTCERCPIQVP